MQDWSVDVAIDDGHLLHAAVGSFAPNAFGLHDVLGNVFEWCQDRWVAYTLPPRPGDGLRTGRGSRLRLHRGGSFYLPASAARSAYRNANDASYRAGHVGCRPARSVTE
jgi:formylglycine-generating enzyme required for sulfatase activity